MNLETTEIPIDELIPYAQNAKIHTDAQIEHIANSIRRFGFNDPVGVWHNDAGEIEIVTGHGAVKAAALLGMDTVPCNFLDHLTDEQRRAYCHVHNQTQIETGFDESLLIADMSTIDMDWESLGFEGYAFNPEEFGTGFSLEDGDGPKFKYMSLTLTEDQYTLITIVLDSIEARGGGSHYGNCVYEVCKQWAER